MIGCSVSAFDIFAMWASGPLIIDGCLSESCARFFQMGPNGSAVPQPVIIRNCNVYSPSMASDRQFIKFCGVGPFVVDGCQIGYGLPRPLLYCLIGAYGGSAYFTGTLTVTNNAFYGFGSNSEDPVIIDEMFGVTPCRLTRGGNLYSDEEGHCQPAVFEDQILYGALAGIRGVSSSGVQSRNLAGQGTASGSAASVTVTFTASEIDTSYRLSLTPVSSVGTPAPGSNRVLSVVKTTTGFTAGLEQAPGAGNSITFDWLLLR
jgi:hypothetical protein